VELDWRNGLSFFLCGTWESLTLSKKVSFYIYIYIYIYLSLSLSLSLSLKSWRSKVERERIWWEINWVY
jgi:hypothetical protein